MEPLGELNEVFTRSAVFLFTLFFFLLVMQLDPFLWQPVMALNGLMGFLMAGVIVLFEVGFFVGIVKRQFNP